MRLLLPALLISSLALPCFAKDTDDAIVTVLGGKPITLGEVDASGSSQLSILKDQLHWARLEAAQDLVARRLLEIEAKEQGLSLSSFIDKEIHGKVPEITDEDVAAFWAGNPGAAPPEGRAALVESVKGFLKRERSLPIRMTLLERLRAKHAAGLQLNIPSARVPLDLTGRPTKGSPSAAVTVVAFTDYQCGGCATLVKELAGLESNFGRHLRFAHVDFPSEHHDRAIPAAVAARCAGRFGKYWEYHDRAFDDVNDLSDERLASIAAELGLDGQAFADCIALPEVLAEVEADRAVGHAAGVTGTPHLFVNGLPLKGGLNTQQLGQIIAMELDRIGVAPPSGS
jgi:protein-disulfide isomerase